MRRGFASFGLLAGVLALATALALWKRAQLGADAAASAAQPEPTESVTAATARPHAYQRTTTAIGTVLALRSVSVQNELAGTVREVRLEPGQIVEAGTLLVALDVSVEEAELEAQEAEEALAETLLGRVRRALENRGASAADVDRARAERDVARAQVARTQAIIERKTIRAPFRARVGLADVHPGQYLNEGTVLTTLQGVDEEAHVDFTVTQDVAARLDVGAEVAIAADGSTSLVAKVVALDARIDPGTRNALVRARIDATSAPPPGASVRVLVPVGEERTTVTVPVNALRKGPGGDHVFVLFQDEEGRTRARVRPVESGAMLGDEVVIEAGLEPGEEVAASGSFKLHEGMLVAVVPDEALPVAAR